MDERAEHLLQALVDLQEQPADVALYLLEELERCVQEESLQGARELLVRLKETEKTAGAT